MVSGDTSDNGGWFEWTYKGVDHTIPGNGGLECRDFLSFRQKWAESVVACTVAVCALIYAWPHLKLPKSCPCIYQRKNDQPGKRILLLLMCLTFGIELGFKFATRQMIWIGNPCHIVTMIQIFILAAPPGRIVTAVFRLHLHMLTGAPIAILFPVVNTRVLPFETGVYYVQHILMLIIPFYLLHAGDPFIPEQLDDFSWALTSLGFLFLYHFLPLQLLAYISHVNLNNILCPAISDPFHGQFYRVFAICHQIILILILGKILVVIAKYFRILPRYHNNFLAVANVCLCVPSCLCHASTCGVMSSIDRPSSMLSAVGKGITLDNCDCVGTIHMFNNNPVRSKHNNRCCMRCCCGGDTEFTCRDAKPRRHSNTDSNFSCRDLKPRKNSITDANFSCRDDNPFTP